MLRTMMKSKIHRATVTQADLHYVGSVTVDAENRMIGTGSDPAAPVPGTGLLRGDLPAAVPEERAQRASRRVPG